MTLTEKITRVIFVIACIILGVTWARYLTGEMGVATASVWWQIGGGVVGLGVSLLILFLLHFVTQEMYERMAPALVAIVLAMVMGYFVGQYIMFWYPEADVTLRIFVVVTFVLLFGYAGINLGLTRASNWESLISAVQHRRSDICPPKLVDTCILIDGRIADICKAGFIEGTLLVPRFVLRELQYIADSEDVLRRAKGRRGLDILNEIQHKDAHVRVEILEDDPTDRKEVDAKLVYLAKKYNARILTVDFNLNKVAQIEGVDVLNINDLANALKPAVLPDEQLVVKIIKEGKEANQGVGYLDDGTMVVVDGGRYFMGKTVQVIVTSVLQTAAGRLIFTKMGSVVS
jgi:uncharacterized protein YacL